MVSHYLDEFLDAHFYWDARFARRFARFAFTISHGAAFLRRTVNASN
jgi:hypothetical protein